jgi:hypothetical protein
VNSTGSGRNSWPLKKANISRFFISMCPFDTYKLIKCRFLGKGNHREENPMPIFLCSEIALRIFNITKNMIL